MAEQFDNEMRGVLFRNKDKQPGDRRPNAKGRIQIGGVVYWLASWTETSRNGEKYQQLRAERAEAQHQPQGAQQTGGAAPASAPAQAEDFGMASGTDPDDIPF